MRYVGATVVVKGGFATPENPSSSSRTLFIGFDANSAAGLLILPSTPFHTWPQEYVVTHQHRS